MDDLKKFYKKLTSSTQYSLVLIIYIILALLLFSVIIENQIQETAASNLQQSLVLQANNIEKVTEQQLQALETLAGFVSTQDELVNEQTLNLADNLAKNTSMSKLYIITPDGIAHVHNKTSFNALDRPFFKRSMKGERVVTRSVSSENDDEYRIVLSVPIYRNGEIKGVAGGSFKLSDIAQLIFPSQTFRENGHVFVVNSDGDFIAVDSSDYFHNERNFFDCYANAKLHNTTFKKIKKEMKNDKSDYYILEKDDVPMYLAISPLGIDDWSLGYIIPTDVANQPYQFFRMHEMALFGVIGFGVLAYFLAIFRLIHLEQKQLYKQATYDSLTNLYNKKQTEQLISERLIDQKLKALLIIDLDDFKRVNDKYGHVIGDHFLESVANMLKGMFRNYDIVGRIGGDEMMVLMDQVVSPNDVYIKCQKIIDEIAKIKIGQNIDYQPSCSIGIAFYPNDSQTFEELYQKADKALYKMKESGKRGYWIYEEQ